MAEEVFGVVGGGIIGLAIAREITRRRPGAHVVVLEKEDRVAVHQTRHNSGVVHAGIYYRPGSLKARLCREGAVRLKEYCAERSVPYEECGKLVVAVRERDLAGLERLWENATSNGVPDLRRVARHEIREIEPFAAGLAAIHSPRTAITDYTRVAEAMAADVVEAGGEVRLGFEVVEVARARGRIEVRSATDSVTVDRLVTCAGLQADRVAGLAGDAAQPQIVPFRGEYMSIRPEKRHLVRGLIYPVPDPRYPFLGVHFTRRVSGEVEIGPNAVLGLAREGYRRSDARLDDLRAMASWPGTWRLARRHWRTGIKELLGSSSKHAYLRDARRYVPGVGVADVVRAGAGVRAQAVDRDGALVDDFRITELDGVTCVRNAPSPGATSSLAIASHVVDLVLGHSSG